MEKKLNVGIVGQNSLIARMFLNDGWSVWENIDNERDSSKDLSSIDILVFTGGEDVSPELYGEENIASGNNSKRDQHEMEVYFDALAVDIPMVGICRGGQFLNVMNGGGMWQHVTDHAISGVHPARCISDGKIYSVTSTHHQMMVPNPSKAQLLLSSDICQEKFSPKMHWKRSAVNNQPDVEALYYKDTNCLCFQPHPEYHNCPPETRELFFRFINTLSLMKGK